MAERRAHYIVRFGNKGLAPRVSAQAPNHWYHLAPRHIWGLPHTFPHVKVRSQFEADLDNPRVATYLWFLCNGHGGPGHFVQAGVGLRRVHHGPVADGEPRIEADMLSRLQEGFDHWFEWQPASPLPGFEERVSQVPVPLPHFIPTLRRVTEEHPSFTQFEALIDREEAHIAAVAELQNPTAVSPTPSTGLPDPVVSSTAVPRPAPSAPASRLAPATIPVLQADLANRCREQTNPHSSGYVYLIQMEGTTFFKIGMSIDPEVRLRTLQTGNPYMLHLIAAQDVQDMRSVESALHRRFEAQRAPNESVREWFDLVEGPDLVQSALGALE